MAGALSSVANLAVTTAHQQQQQQGQAKSSSHSGCLNMGESSPSLESKVDDVAR